MFFNYIKISFNIINLIDEEVILVSTIHRSTARTNFNIFLKRLETNEKILLLAVNY